MPVPARPLPRRRRTPVPRALVHLRARPLLWWAATIAVAVATAGAVGGAVSQAQARAARYGAARPVLVATRDVAAGTVLDEAGTDVVALPSALVPPGAVGAEALGRRVARPIHDGEVVHARRLAPDGLSAVAARLPPGSRGVAVPAGPDALPLEVGDVVDVLATVGDAGPADPTGPPTVTVASGAVVVDVGEQVVTVAVAPDQAPKVAFAVTAGIATLALVPG